tara:strand:+ start:134 stop:499 length:366 start_codon:yes stop_codon:yes gene_type:complete
VQRSGSKSIIKAGEALLLNNIQEKEIKMTDITKNLIKRAIRASFPGVNEHDIYFQDDEGCFRDWSYSKEPEDIYPEEQDAEWAACKKFASMVPGFEVERGDKNYFDIKVISKRSDYVPVWD